MTQKENMTRAIEFRNPKYMPADLNFSPGWLYEKDTAKITYIESLISQLKLDVYNPCFITNAITNITERDGRKYWTDEWGTGWEDDGYGSKAEIFPLQGGYDLLDTYVFPDSKIGSQGLVKHAMSQYDGSKYLCASIWFTLFERLWMLRGFENMLTDPYTETENFEHLRDRILAFNMDRIEQWLEYKVDGIYFSDDWGTQRGMLMNPDDWRRYYKPAYQKMFSRVREAGAHVWMHLCGNILDILPDLIELGLNVLNPIQKQSMSIHYLAEQFGGKVCFCGGVDVQQTLILGTPRQDKEEVNMLNSILGNFGGGYICNTSHTIMPETPLNNIIALYEAAIELQGA